MPVKLAVAVVGAFLIAVSPTCAAKDAALQDEIPSALSLDKESSPYFVAADAVMTASGHLNRDLLGSEAEVINVMLGMKEVGGCIHLGDVQIDDINLQEFSDLPGATKVSTLILDGRVTASRPGFRGSTPGTILKVKPESIVKNQTGATHAFYYLFVPIGTVHIGHKVICKQDSRYAELPHPGDEVIVFSQTKSKDMILQLTSLSPDELVLVHAGGSVQLSGRLRAIQGDLSRRQVMSEIARTLAGDEK